MTMSITSKQFEESFLIRTQNGARVAKNFAGSETNLFQSGLATSTVNGVVITFNRINFKNGFLKTFANPIGVNDDSKFVFSGFDSTAIISPNQQKGSLTLSAFCDNSLRPGPNVSTESVENVDFIFHFDFAGNGTWDYDFNRESAGQNTHLFEDGIWVQEGSSGSGNSYAGSVTSVSKIGLVVTDFTINGGLGINWIYYVADASDFVFGIFNHPTTYFWDFQPYSRDYIFEYLPIV